MTELAHTLFVVGNLCRRLPTHSHPFIAGGILTPGIERRRAHRDMTRRPVYYTFLSFCFLKLTKLRAFVVDILLNYVRSWCISGAIHYSVTIYCLYYSFSRIDIWKIFGKYDVLFCLRHVSVFFAAGQNLPTWLETVENRRIQNMPYNSLNIEAFSHWYHGYTDTTEVEVLKVIGISSKNCAGNNDNDDVDAKHVRVRCQREWRDLITFEQHMIIAARWCWLRWLERIKNMHT